MLIVDTDKHVSSHENATYYYFGINYVAKDKEDETQENQTEYSQLAISYYQCNSWTKVRYENYKKYEINNIIEIKHLPSERLYPFLDEKPLITKCACCYSQESCAWVFVIVPLAIFTYVSFSWNDGIIGIVALYGFAIVFLILWKGIIIVNKKYCKCKCNCSKTDKRTETLITKQEYKSIIREFNFAYRKQHRNDILITQDIEGGIEFVTKNH